MDSSDLLCVITIQICVGIEENFCYYIHKTRDIQNGIFVDVAESHVLGQILKDFRIKDVSNIFTTHKHRDHSAENNFVGQRFNNCNVYGGAADKVVGATYNLKKGDGWEAFLRVQCIAYHTSCLHLRQTLFFIFSNIFVLISTSFLLNRKHSW